ncbi:RagB/SusD family nutrient uptake outer membrane protein [Flavobacterium psychrophilum]|nr:RagB/SusD family nutrient uptake outer membrane protein [Flavobacterium psychrophilum]
MKNTFLYISIVMFGITSCQTDLDAIPEDLTTRELTFKTRLGVESYVTGIYGLAQQEGALNGVPQLLGEYQSDNVTFRGSFPTLIDIRDYNTLSDNSSILSIWRDHYEVIAQTNYLITNIDKCLDATFDQVGRDQAIGEAKFMRALMYLQLTNLFSQPVQSVGVNALAVPLVLKSTEDKDLGINDTPRATIGEVYSQIEADLLDASTKLTVMNRTRANSAAAKALLARVYLYQDKFAQAADFSNKVILDSNFRLASNFLFYDTPVNEEHVFTLVNSKSDPSTNSTLDASSAVGFTNETNSVDDGGRGDCPFSVNLRAAFSAGDLRFALKKQDVGTQTPRFFTTKFNDGINNSSDVPVIRISEMYLIRAEANFRSGSAIGDSPLNDLNKVHVRAGLAPLVVVDLPTILNERRYELCFEGFRRMDLLRNGLKLRSATLPQTALSIPGMNKVILPIPQAEMDLSKGRKLVQNPGY